MACALDAFRGADFLRTYVFPDDTDLSTYEATMVVYDELGGATLLTVSQVPGVNGSFTAIAQNAISITIKADDIDDLPEAADTQEPALLQFDLFLNSAGDVVTKIDGGLFRVRPVGASTGCSDPCEVTVTFGGDTVEVTILGGPSYVIDIEASAFGASIVQAEDASEVLDALGVSAFMQGVLPDANAAEVLTDLGVSSFMQTVLQAETRADLLNTNDIQSRIVFDISLEDDYDTADATPAFEAAYARAVASGQPALIHVPESCSASGTWTFEDNGIGLRGGSRQVVVTPTAGTADFLVFGDGVTQSGNYTLRDIYINAINRTGGSVLRAQKIAYLVGSNITFDNVWNGLDLETVNTVAFDDMILNKKAANASDFAVKMHSPDGERSDVVSLTNMTLQGFSSTTADCLVMDGLVYGLHLDKVFALGWNRNIRTINTTGNPANTPAFITANDFESDRAVMRSVSLEVGSNFYFSNCDISNTSDVSTQGGNDEAVFYVALGVSDVTVNGGRITNGQRQAIHVLGSALFNGVLIRDISKAGVGSYPAVTFGATCTDSAFIGGHIDGASRASVPVQILSGADRVRVITNPPTNCVSNTPTNAATGSITVDTGLNRSIQTSSSGMIEDVVRNSATGAGVIARRTSSTGTANSYVVEDLRDVSGAPNSVLAGGPAVTIRYQDFDVEAWRSNAAVEKGRIDTAGLKLPTGRAYYVNNLQVLGARKTGWATATGTATRTTFDTTTVTLPQLAERLKALIDDLHATAGQGIIGT